jgi:spermidine synthase
MTKVGEHITLDIIGTTQEYDHWVYEYVIRKIENSAEVTVI